MVVLINKILASVAAVAVCFLWSIPQVHASVFYPEHYTLANGTQLVLVKNKLSPAVGHMVWYKVGALDEVSGKTGVAHYLEHMMFKGTQKIPVGRFHKAIASKGGNENAFTAHDYTAYHEVIAAKHLGLVMQMEADRMRGLKINPEQARREKKVVLSERQQRTENSPNGLFIEKFRKKLFGSHPYGRPVIGWKSDIEALSPADLKAFYQKYYDPNQAIVVVTGNIQTKEVLRLAAATYGRLPSALTKEKKEKVSVQKPKESIFVYEDARVRQPYATRKMIAPSYSEDKKLSLAMDVLAEILNADVGPLYCDFVVDKKMASAVAVSYNGLTRGPSLFALSVSPAPGLQAQKVDAAMMESLRKIAKKGFSKKEVNAAKQRLLDSAVFARDKLMAPAQILGQALAIGLPLNAIEEWPADIRRVTRAEVNHALRQLLVTPYQMLGVLKEKNEGV